MILPQLCALFIQTVADFQSEGIPDGVGYPAVGTQMLRKDQLVFVLGQPSLHQMDGAHIEAFGAPRLNVQIRLIRVLGIRQRGIAQAVEIGIGFDPLLRLDDGEILAATGR